MRKIRTSGREAGHYTDAVERAAEWANRHGTGLDGAERFLERAGWLHATFGRESVRFERGERYAEYLNAGDSYDLTLLQEEYCDVRAISWADWLQEVEKEWTADTGEIYCNYCGEWSDPAESEDDYEIRCQDCYERAMDDDGYGRCTDCSEWVEFKNLHEDQWCEECYQRELKDRGYRECFDCRELFNPMWSNQNMVCDGCAV